MRGNKLVWIPRILAIALNIFLATFAFDVFEGQISIWEQLLGFLIHLTPNFILLVITIIAWKVPRIGGVLFFLVSAFFAVFFRVWNVASEVNIFRLVLVVLIATIGVMFLVFGNRIVRPAES